MPGYEDSYGVQLELSVANTMDKPVIAISWSELKPLLSRDMAQYLERDANTLSAANAHR